MLFVTNIHNFNCSSIWSWCCPHWPHACLYWWTTTYIENSQKLLWDVYLNWIALTMSNHLTNLNHNLVQYFGFLSVKKSTFTWTSWPDCRSIAVALISVSPNFIWTCNSRLDICHYKKLILLESLGLFLHSDDQLQQTGDWIAYW